MSFWNESAMAKRLNWERIHWDRKSRVSLSKDREFMQSELATDWLQRREKWLADQAKLRKCKSPKKSKAP
jgi:hypothetical protein